MIPSSQVKSEITKYLLEKYQKKGRDFYVKSNQIPLPYSVWRIGWSLSSLCKDGKLIKWHEHKKTKSMVWRTQFKGKC